MHRQGRVEIWAMMGPDPDSPLSSWRGGLCERTCPSLYGVAGLGRRSFSKKKVKKETLRGCLGNSPAAAALASSPPSYAALLWCRRPQAHTQSPRKSACLNLLEWRLLGNWAGGWLSADQEGRREKPIPTQPAVASKTSKTDLASLKPARGFFFFF